MSAVFAVEFETPGGETLYFEWNPESLEHLDGDLGEATPWQLDGELDWDEVELIRVLSARFDDGRVLGVAALRPAGADGHGQELVVSALADREGEVEPVSETLLSAEYDASGVPRRVGLELYRGEGSVALRVGGVATASDRELDGAIQRTSVALEMRLAGAAGRGRLDLLRVP